MNDADSALVVFRGKEIRRAWHDGQWYFVVVDIVGALTDSINPTDYLKKLRKRDNSLNEGWGQFVTPLDIQTSGGIQQINCMNTENAFRLIQSTPSKKAEPFKRWLAKVGYERVQEIENPELAMRRMKEFYASKGYSEEWIEKRARGIAVRDELTDEWDKRGIETDREFSILTAEISKAAFGLTPTEYLAHKGLKRQNLRDHMDDLELIFTMLGEAATTEIARAKDARGFVENKNAAKNGGAVSGDARRDLETKTGKPVVTGENFLDVPEKVKRLGKRK
ncbi:MAG: Bro-N domain-containing protein [Thermoplasmata archaeon]|nr:Bro-N domain-containing protein [Thermoplasmata archaeon]